MSDKFEFIDAEYADSKASKNADAPSIVKMCRWLDVKRSSFTAGPGNGEAARRTQTDHHQVVRGL